jgi:hypothetical protein
MTTEKADRPIDKVRELGTLAHNQRIIDLVDNE